MDSNRQITINSSRIIVSADMGEGRMKHYAVCTAVDIGNALVSNHFMPADDLSTALMRMRGIHLNTLMGNLINGVMAEDEKKIWLHEFVVFKLDIKYADALRKMGVQFNKEGGRGTGNKCYIPLYAAVIVPEMFKIRIRNINDAYDSTIGKGVYSRQRAYNDACLTALSKPGCVVWTKEDIHAENIIVTPHSTEKTMARRSKDADMRVCNKKLNLTGGKQ